MKPFVAALLLALALLALTLAFTSRPAVTAGLLRDATTTPALVALEETR